MKSLLMQITPLLLLMTLAVSTNAQEPIVTESTTTSTVTTNGSMETIVKSPPPSAISPQIISNGNSDLCTFGVAGAVQTQILGISMGSTIRDENCEKLKNAKTLYDMGMKVAAVSVMCQDQRVFDAMMDAGTPCPYDGLIGDEAKKAWESKQLAVEVGMVANSETEEGGLDEKRMQGASAVAGVLSLLLLL
jgi:hypothetical protein